MNNSLCGQLNILSGGRLQGGGTVCGMTATGGGTVAPGVNSIDTLTVNGAFTLNPGAIFEVDVDAAGQSDLVTVTGAVNLTDSILQVLAANQTYDPTTDYLIIDNDGADAVVGQFAQVTTNFAFLTPTVLYDAGDGNDVVLTLVKSATFTSITETSNEKSVAEALEKFPTDSELSVALLNQTVAGALQAFNALSGEIHATLPGVLADDIRYVREAILGRLMQANYANTGGQLASLGAAGPQVAARDANAMALGYADDAALDSAYPGYGPGLVFWTQGFGAWGDFDGNRNAATADRNLGGFVSGMDARLSGTWRAGLATGASYSDVTVADRSSSAEVESYHLAGYTGGMAGPLALRGGGSWSWNEIDTSRAVIFPGFFERQKASYDSDTGQVFGEVAIPSRMGGIAFEPFAGLAHVSVETDSFRESGGNLAGLRGSANDQDVNYSTLGLRAATTWHWNSMVVTPYVSAAWMHAFDDVTPGAALAFSTTGIGFGVTGVPLAEDTALIDAGLDFRLGPNTTAAVSYSGRFGDKVADNAVKGRLTWLF